MHFSPRHLICEGVKKKKKPLSQHSAQGGAGGGGRRRKPVSMMSQHCIWSRMADVHAALRLDGRPGQLAPLGALLSPSTVYFEDGARNYSALTHK